MNGRRTKSPAIPTPIHVSSSPIMQPLSGPPSPTHSVAATAVTHWTALPAAPDMAQVGGVLESMRHTLENLGVTFGTLGEQSSKIAGLGDGFDNASQLASLERHLAASDRKQDKRMEEIKVLLGQVVLQDIVPHVDEMIDDSIAAEIDSIIEKQVELQLAHEIPKHLQQQIRDHKKELEGVRINLQNSEARRANALLRSSHLNDPLQPLLKDDGTISANFPANLTALFALDGPSAQDLGLEYRLKGVTDIREKNLNLFMQFCGVAYQMLPIEPLPPSSEPTQSFPLSSEPTTRSLPGSWVESEVTEQIPDVHAHKIRAPRRDAFGVQFLGSLLAATGQLTLLYLAAS